MPSSSGDVEPRPAPQQGAFQITSQSNTGHSASQKSQTAQETRQVIDQWDPKKRQSLEQLFGVARVGSSARDPRASPRSQATAFSQASFGSGNPHTPRSQASLFNVLAAATDSAPSQRPDHFLTHEKTKQVSEERNIANRRSANMADIAEHPSSPGNSSDYSASHPSTITSLSIPSTRSHSDDKSLAASVPNHPGSNWGDFGFPSEGARLQRRLSQRDPSPASSPKSPTRTLEASFMNLNTETLPEDEDAGSFEGGMASTNVSVSAIFTFAHSATYLTCICQPFTRDGRMPLPPLTANVPAPRTREHSLGPVGSGRRNTGTWNGPASATAPTRAFVFDDNESDEEGAASRVNLAASRRHSLATFPGQSQVGFQLPASPSSASRFSPASTGPRELLPSSGVGSSALRFNDDELVDSLNSLHLNLDHQSSSASTAAPAASPRHSHIGQPFIVPRPQSFGGRRASSSSVEGVYQPMMGPAGSPRMSGGAGIPQPGSPFFNPSANPAQTQLQGYPPMSSSHMPSNNGRVLSASAHPLQSITPGFTDPNSMPTYFGAQRHQEPDLAEFGRGVRVPIGHICSILMHARNRCPSTNYHLNLNYLSWNSKPVAQTFSFQEIRRFQSVKATCTFS